MKMKSIIAIVFAVGVVLGMAGMDRAQAVDLKEYNAVVVQNLEVPTGSPAPESSGAQMAEKAVFQIKRYNEGNKLFDFVKTGKGAKEIPAGKKVLIIKGEVTGYTASSVGAEVRRSFMPGGEWTGTAGFSAHYKFVDKATGNVIYETDLKTSSTSAQNTVEYAMERNGEALAKVIVKMKK